MAVTEEERALRDADKAYKQRVKKAERAVASAEEGDLLDSYGKAKLYGDRLVHGSEELALSADTVTDVQATGTKTTGKNASDTRELYLVVENANGGLTIKCRPDDGEKVRAFAQKIRLAAPVAAEAAAARQRQTLAARQTLEEVRADRAEIEAAERALPADAVEKVRRRQRLAWVKWTVAAVGVVVVLAAIAGGGSGDEAPSSSASTATAPRLTTPPPPAAKSPVAVQPPAPPKSPRQKLREALRELDAKIDSVSAKEIAITAKTPQGGFEGASTGDLNRRAGEIFTAIYGRAGYHRASIIVFKGGLVDTKTGADLPNEETGIFAMNRADSDAIDWSDEDRLLVIDWKNFREFAHPALKQDE